MGCRCTSTNTSTQFGFDCSQEVVKDTLNSVPATPVVAGAAVALKSPGGVGVSIPAGALGVNATLEVQVYDVEVKISDEQPGDPIAPAGKLGVFLPHGLQFAEPVTLTLEYDPSKVPEGDDVFVFYFNEDKNPPVWEKMQSTVVGNSGLIECSTTHFSTFGPMSSRSSSAVTTPRPPVATTTPPPKSEPVAVAPPPGNVAAPNEEAGLSTLVIVLVTVGGIVGGLILFACLFLFLRKASQNKQPVAPIDSVIGFSPRVESATTPASSGEVAFTQQRFVRHERSLPASDTEEQEFVASQHELSGAPEPALVSLPVEPTTALISSGRSPTGSDAGSSTALKPNASPALARGGAAAYLLQGEQTQSRRLGADADQTLASDIIGHVEPAAARVERGRFAAPASTRATRAAPAGASASPTREAPAPAKTRASDIISRVDGVDRGKFSPPGAHASPGGGAQARALLERGLLKQTAPPPARVDKKSPESWRRFEPPGVSASTTWAEPAPAVLEGGRYKSDVESSPARVDMARVASESPPRGRQEQSDPTANTGTGDVAAVHESAPRFRGPRLNRFAARAPSRGVTMTAPAAGVARIGRENSASQDLLGTILRAPAAAAPDEHQPTSAAASSHASLHATPQRSRSPSPPPPGFPDPPRKGRRLLGGTS